MILEISVLYFREAIQCLNNSNILEEFEIISSQTHEFKHPEI